MDFQSAMRISASGLKANRVWINVVSANLANINTTRTAEGTPYRRRTLILEATPVESDFQAVFDEALEGQLERVDVSEIVPDGRDFTKVYDPSHPDANKEGYVLKPNINPVEEMANMMSATRSYEANLAALNTARQLALKALEIGR
ncbi:flagellar basal-body rod protein FlgC [Desulfacinum hydrothermale DSM 13146]|uniref:Flagellar basal-body rod protein FlgC n=1 Tax=Desulfacinum hydrothermale DSM 13146 TaxID=1121390 RepID=A0A1W1X5I3_9BACT|nr:flagellar basal body rod protein FlgC [Desulfacinum hydrothermale]SMC19219.1 flagellar basal-body rod protein FlgC [Desulfacinum hydrothermale DSM 13146]